MGRGCAGRAGQGAPVDLQDCATTAAATFPPRPGPPESSRSPWRPSLQCLSMPVQEGVPADLEVMYVGSLPVDVTLDEQDVSGEWRCLPAQGVRGSASEAKPSPPFTAVACAHALRLLTLPPIPTHSLHPPCRTFPARAVGGRHPQEALQLLPCLPRQNAQGKILPGCVGEEHPSALGCCMASP